MLKIDKLSYQFQDNKVLDTISCEFKKGKIYGILGKNGAGKTTLFRCVTQIYTDYVGNILHLQKQLNRKQIAFLATSNFHYPYITGKEHLQLAAVSKDKIEIIQQLFDLPLNEYVHEYSTGMKKKLSFAACILANRDIIILDEPFNGVDLMSNELILQLLLKIKKEKVIIMSSHILETLTSICDKILLLENGQLLKEYERTNFEQLKASIRNDVNEQKNNFIQELITK